MHECLRPANSNESIPFGELSNQDRARVSLNNRQVIVTSYQFQCHGNITAWRTYVSPSGESHRDGAYVITFQVWRPSNSAAVDGCYSLVGQDVYRNITLLEATGGLVNRTVPQPSDLTVQPGDVIGFHVFSDRGDNDAGIQFSENEEMGFTEEQAWYNEDVLMLFGSEVCPFPVGQDRVLTGSIRAAPVLSIDIGNHLVQIYVAMKQSGWSGFGLTTFC